MRRYYVPKARMNTYLHNSLIKEAWNHNDSDDTEFTNILMMLRSALKSLPESASYQTRALFDALWESVLDDEKTVAKCGATRQAPVEPQQRSMSDMMNDFDSAGPESYDSDDSGSYGGGSGSYGGGSGYYGGGSSQPRPVEDVMEEYTSRGGSDQSIIRDIQNGRQGHWEEVPVGGSGGIDALGGAKVGRTLGGAGFGSYMGSGEGFAGGGVRGGAGGGSGVGNYDAFGNPLRRTKKVWVWDDNGQPAGNGASAQAEPEQAPAQANDDLYSNFTQLSEGEPSMTIENTSVQEMMSVLNQKLHEGPCAFIYEKKDGSERLAYGTLNADYLNSNVGARGNGGGRRGAGNKFYYDLEQGAFRQFSPERLIAVY